MQVVVEAAQFSDEDLGEFLRSRGLHVAQLEEWRQKVEEAAVGALGSPKKRRRGKSPEAKRLQELDGRGYPDVRRNKRLLKLVPVRLVSRGPKPQCACQGPSGPC